MCPGGALGYSNSGMQPYVVRQGDYLAKLAYRCGFDANAVWADPANARLRDARPDPNILFPGDVLWIPDPEPPVWHSVTLGTTNTFTVDSPTTSITVRFLDESLASQPVTVHELPKLTGLTTAADGSVSLDVPVFVDVLTFVFTNAGVIRECRIGHVDPIDTLSGVFCRLQNLGYLPLDVAIAGTDIESIREALRAFNADRGAGAASESSSSGSGAPLAQAAQAEPSAEATRSDGSLPSSSTLSSASSQAEAKAPADAGSLWPHGCPIPDSDDAVDSGDEGAPPLPPPVACDHAGLADNGTLDSATAQALVQAHGS